jgi:tail tube protein
VKTVNSPSSVTVNAPFTVAPASGGQLTGAVTYKPAAEMPSLSIFDYWDPAWAVNRLLIGAAVGQLEIKVNADFHEFEFKGEAQDVLDTVSFAAGQGGLSSFPAEPAVAGFTGVPVPGNLGQAWLGATASKFVTVTKASISLDNDLDLRNREFGSSVPLCHGGGLRKVLAELRLYEDDDAATRGLYQAARAQTPIGVMFQLGQAAGSLFGAYLKTVVPKVPEFDDADRILEWSFSDCRAQGAGDDEIYVAFG